MDSQSEKDAFEEEEGISDEDLRQAIDDVEFDMLVREEFRDDEDNKPEVKKSQEEFDKKLKDFVERILILAKDKALLKNKLKRVEASKKLQANFLRNE